MTATGAERIAAERERQIEHLGYTADHDNAHDDNDLAFAAVCYAAPAPVYLFLIDQEANGPHGKGGHVRWVEPWPIGWERTVTVNPTPEQRMRQLEKAGALIAAEIDRIQARLPVEEEDDE